MMRLRVTLLVLALFVVARGAIADTIGCDSDRAFQVKYVCGLQAGDSVIIFSTSTVPTSTDPTPVMPTDIVDWSVNATGTVPLEMSSMNESAMMSCDTSCFDVSTNGLSMRPGSSITFMDMQGQGEGMTSPTMLLTPTTDPTLIQATWFDALNPNVVATGQGRAPAVPEPATLTLVGLGMIGLGLCRRRRG